VGPAQGQARINYNNSAVWLPCRLLGVACFTRVACFSALGKPTVVPDCCPDQKSTYAAEMTSAQAQENSACDEHYFSKTPELNFSQMVNLYNPTHEKAPKT
jgi:hypothetical protein